ncbi:double substrate-specificity short chain dehydrogenase reductase 2 [Fusarium subglutinans]|uniref:Double substrate-specificity short chain dehydrogenase reductase 2 n=1 Tax=Gibberella subglutinans TaxID=42677 RepID=A0A8H5PJ32_GIBSU|nr:double substrate-specificity short chain dehydrogenase reductase 2 [Fusarium subglutinans]KAF5597448.1 double substrate-specificity short chain dehydrogenase reductase 2 [Fusarium subglutinans]
MTSTTSTQSNGETEGLEVAQAFSAQVLGKVVLVTGVNRGGIGYSTAEALASQGPSHLIVTSRSRTKLQESVDAMKSLYAQVNYVILQFDLSSQQSVRAAAAELLSRDDIPKIDLLINNAGVAFLPERLLSPENIEMHFATNHIGHFLFTSLILPKLIKAAEESPKGATRIINVSSGSPKWAYMRWSDINLEKKNKELPEEERPNYEVHRAWGSPNVEELSYIPLTAYNQSKVANVLFSIGANNNGWIETDLSRHMPSETREAIVKVGIQRGVKYKTLQAGGSTTVVAALDPKLGPGEKREGKENYGVFLEGCQICSGAHPRAESDEEAERLWELSEKLTSETS